MNNIKVYIVSIISCLVMFTFISESASAGTSLTSTVTITLVDSDESSRPGQSGENEIGSQTTNESGDSSSDFGSLENEKKVKKGKNSKVKKGLFPQLGEHGIAPWLYVVVGLSLIIVLSKRYERFINKK